MNTSDPTSETASNRPRQLRLILVTEDFDEAVRFYRDVLGMPEQPAFATSGADRVSILDAGTATIELATPEHGHAIDTLEEAPEVQDSDGPVLRLALEVGDTEAALHAAEKAGSSRIAPAVETPFRTINARVEGPAGWQVTFFQELETLEHRSGREGFTTDEERPA